MMKKFFQQLKNLKIYRILIIFLEGWYYAVIITSSIGLFFIVTLILCNYISPPGASGMKIFFQHCCIVSIPLALINFFRHKIYIFFKKSKLNKLSFDINTINFQIDKLTEEENLQITEAKESDELLKANKVHPNQIKKLKGIEFENFLFDTFSLLEYEVTKTKISGDYGVDLILKKNNITTAVQVKGSENTIGVKAIQEVYSGKDYYNCNQALIITNSTYTKNAIKQAKKLNVLLYDKTNLISLLPNTDLIKERNMKWREYYKTTNEIQKLHYKKLNLIKKVDAINQKVRNPLSYRRS